MNNNTDAISLFELNNRIKASLKSNFPKTVWLRTEIAELRHNSVGHCYLQFADKDESGNKILATAKATIWATKFRMIKTYFETTTGRSLSQGIKVLVNVEIVFHEVYGFSLNVLDIDPSYTLGDIERRKKEILKRLKDEGIIDMNKKLPFPSLPKNIAVISSATAAGYGDFVQQINNNIYSYKFNFKLFPAIMQGDATADSIISVLDRIYQYEDFFDVVVVIRGGGAQLDLAGFDSYELAANIAQFPIPVITGIGHERDETIVDYVANVRMKTPTAVAAYLIDCFHNEDLKIEELTNVFLSSVGELLDRENEVMKSASTVFRQVTTNIITNNQMKLNLYSSNVGHLSTKIITYHNNDLEQRIIKLNGKSGLLFENKRNYLKSLMTILKMTTSAILETNKKKIEFAELKAKYASPDNILKKGYSVARVKGKLVSSVNDLRKGDIITTSFIDGEITSVVD